MSARQILDGAMSEKDFMQSVIDCALRRGWLLYHTWDSRRSAGGFPDLVLVRGERIIAAELKTERGEPSVPQLDWLSALERTGKVEAFLWRPSDWPQIEDVLK